jgi:hypothetical protein
MPPSRATIQALLSHLRGKVASGQAAATYLDPPQRAISESLVRKLSPDLVASRGGRGSKWADLSQAEGWNEVAGFRANLDAKGLGPQVEPEVVKLTKLGLVVVGATSPIHSSLPDHPHPNPRLSSHHLHRATPYLTRVRRMP